jgi:putative transcriptional regulator
MKNSIRERRKLLGWKLEDLALKLGVMPLTINAIENNKYNPTLELAMNLARKIKTIVEYLFSIDE